MDGISLKILKAEQFINKDAGLLENLRFLSNSNGEKNKCSGSAA